MLNNFIKNLQQKPYTTRLRILWTVVGITAVILIIVWSTSLKSTLNISKTEDGNKKPVEVVVKNQYLEIERAETTGDLVTIYFKVSNPSSDILNFSPLDSIKLVADDHELKPIKMLDRQSNPFVQKILSKTENFGSLQFSTKTFNTGTLTFGELFFESQPQNIFEEQVEFDLTKILKNQEVRN